MAGISPLKGKNLPARPSASSAAVRRRMQATLRRDTPGELALRTILHRLGLRFRVDWPLPGFRRRADIVFVRARVVVFVDGCFWHGCRTHGTWPKKNSAWWRAKITANRQRDLDTNRRLRRDRWTVVRVWSHDSLPDAAVRIAALVRDLVRGGRPRTH